MLSNREVVGFLFADLDEQSGDAIAFKNANLSYSPWIRPSTGIERSSEVVMHQEWNDCFSNRAMMKSSHGLWHIGVASWRRSRFYSQSALVTDRLLLAESRYTRLLVTKFRFAKQSSHSPGVNFSDLNTYKRPEPIVGTFYAPLIASVSETSIILWQCGYMVLPVYSIVSITNSIGPAEFSS